MKATSLIAVCVERKDRAEYVETLAKETFAHHLASEGVRGQFVKVFSVISSAIERSNFSPEKRRAFGKTLLGLRDSHDIESWISENSGSIILSSDNEDLLLGCLWPIIEKYIGNMASDGGEPRRPAECVDCV